MGLFDFLSTPNPTQAAMTQGDQTNQGGGLLSMSPTQGQMLMALGSGLLSERGTGGLAAGLSGATQVAQNAQKLKAQEEQNKILNEIKGYNAVTGRMGTEGRIQKLQADIAKGQMPKFLYKQGGTVVMQGADGQPITFTSDELQSAFGNEYEQKLNIAKAINLDKQTNANLTGKEQDIAKENSQDLFNAQKNLDTVDQALQAGDSIKPGVGTQLSGMFPGATSVASGFSSSAADARKYQQKVQAVLVSDWLNEGLKLKGAQSDKEGAALKARQPLITDDYETMIKPWLQDMRKWMEEAKKVAEENKARERVPGVSQATGGASAPAAGGSLPAAALGALREGHQTEFNNGQVWTLEGGKAKRIK